MGDRMGGGDVDEMGDGCVIESICVTVNYNSEEEDRPVVSNENCVHRKYKWKFDSLQNVLQSDYIAKIESSIESNSLDNAIESLTLMINDVCYVKQNVSNVDIDCRNEWWDDEMTSLKYKKYNLLRQYRKYHSEVSLNKYKEARKLYKSKIHEKKGALKQKNKKISRSL